MDDGIQVEEFMGWGMWIGGVFESHLAILSQLHSPGPQHYIYIY